jgi:hypothetical protein
MKQHDSALPVSAATAREVQVQGARLGLGTDGIIKLALKALAAQRHDNDAEADRIVATSLDDIDLDDPAIYARSAAAEHLATLGCSMAARYMGSGRLFFLERVDHDGRAYLAIGTRSGPHPRDPNAVVHAFAAPEGLRSIKDAHSDLVVFKDGRQLVTAHDRGESTCFIRFADLEEPHFWRLWVEAGVGRRRFTPYRFRIESNEQRSEGFRIVAPMW